jgi:quinoprotein glucose dehydrogenase
MARTISSSTCFLSVLFALLLPLIRIPPAVSAPIAGRAPQGVEDRFLPEGEGIRVETWVEQLEIPWSLVFLPDGRALVSERPGRIRLIKEGKVQEDPYAPIEVLHQGEGGLMGLALHPQFPQKPYVYAMHTYRKDRDIFNRVIRLKDDGRRGGFDRVIIDGIPGSRLHNGGRIAFGPDDLLYITAGEIFKGELAQDLRSLGGKILRIREDGSIPEDNPFKGSPVYSYGHRNPQGLSWHPETGDLFESEHGPSGESLRFAHDEINVITKGGNHGWPNAIGAPGEKPYIDPLIVWKKTTPPSGIAFYKANLLAHLRGDLFVSTLRSEALIRVRLKPERDRYQVTAIDRWFAEDDRDGKYGRIRDVLTGPDGALYFLTNNRDGRGTPRRGDDRIYRILPK